MSKPKIVFVKSVSEIFQKIRYLRKNQVYVLIDNSPAFGYPQSRSELAEQIEQLENMLKIQRHLGIRAKPAIVFTKRGVR